MLRPLIFFIALFLPGYLHNELNSYCEFPAFEQTLLRHTDTIAFTLLMILLAVLMNKPKEKNET